MDIGISIVVSYSETVTYTAVYRKDGWVFNRFERGKDEWTAVAPDALLPSVQALVRALDRNEDA